MQMRLAKLFGIRRCNNLRKGIGKQFLNGSVWMLITKSWIERFGFCLVHNLCFQRLSFPRVKARSPSGDRRKDPLSAIANLLRCLVRESSLETRVSLPIRRKSKAPI